MTTIEPNAFDAACACREEALRLRKFAFVAAIFGRPDVAATRAAEARECEQEAAHIVTRVTAKEPAGGR